MPLRAIRASLAGFCATAFIALPAVAAPFDGDWEGDLRCEATNTLPSIYEPVLASVRAEQIKLLRGTERDSDVVEGSVGADGTARISGRARLADGSASYLNFAGRFSPGKFSGQGTAVPDSGGAVRQCTLVLEAETIARGEGASPPQSGESNPDEQPGYAPQIVYGNDYYAGGGLYNPTWYDDNTWWRREMMRRWAYRMWMREQGIRHYCQSHPAACGHAAVFTDPPRHTPPHPRPPQLDPQPPTAQPGKPRPPLADQQIVTPSEPRRSRSEGGVTVVRPEPTRPQAGSAPSAGSTGSAPYKAPEPGVSGSPHRTPAATVAPSGGTGSPYKAPAAAPSASAVSPPSSGSSPATPPTTRHDPPPSQSDQRAKCAPGLRC